MNGLSARFSPNASYAALLLAIGVAVALTGGALAVGILPGDAWMRDTLVAHASPPVLRAMRWIRHAGDWRVLVPGTLLLIALSARVRRWWWVWVALIVLAAISEWALKPMVGRLRPTGTAFGFPSGHAAAATAYFGAVIYAATDLPSSARGVVRVAAAVMIILVGLARVLLNAHWPSDVLGGIAIGLTCAIAAVLISGSTPRFPAGPTSPGPPARD